MSMHLTIFSKSSRIAKTIQGYAARQEIKYSTGSENKLDEKRYIYMDIVLAKEL